MKLISIDVAPWTAAPGWTKIGYAYSAKQKNGTYPPGCRVDVFRRGQLVKIVTPKEVWIRRDSELTSTMFMTKDQQAAVHRVFERQAGRERKR